MILPNREILTIQIIRYPEPDRLIGHIQFNNSATQLEELIEGNEDHVLARMLSSTAAKSLELILKKEGR